MPPFVPDILSFVALCIGLALVPGPNLAVVLRSAARGGQRAAWASAAGLTSSKAMWAAASLIGFAQLLSSSAEIYSTLRLPGGLYLIYLGISTFRTNRRSPREAEAGAVAAGEPSVWRAARAGALTDVLNPKVGAFYLAVFPQFIRPGDHVVASASVLLLAHAVVLMTYYPLVAALSLRARRFARDITARRFENGIGVGLIGAGALVVVESQR